MGGILFYTILDNLVGSAVILLSRGLLRSLSSVFGSCLSLTPCSLLFLYSFHVLALHPFYRISKILEAFSNLLISIILICYSLSFLPGIESSFLLFMLFECSVCVFNLHGLADLFCLHEQSLVVLPFPCWSVNVFRLCQNEVLIMMYFLGWVIV